MDGRWIGFGVCYGAYRDGQHPGGIDLPSREQIAEDLTLVLPHWRLLRLYGSVDYAEKVVKTIAEEGLPMRVILGAWIGREELRDQNGNFVRVDHVGRGANKREAREAIRLATAYPEIVIAIIVGSETQVDWSDHRVPAATLIQYIRQVRAGTDLPVATADDFVYWKSTASRAVADEVDFIVAHIYAMWHGKQLPEALEFTLAEYQQIQQTHTGLPIVIGEAGWATQKHDAGLQAELIHGAAGETEQREFYRQIAKWALEQEVPTLYFEAFDENWKGGSHPRHVEKHWGVFRADRTPKAALSPSGGGGIQP